MMEMAVVASRTVKRVQSYALAPFNDHQHQNTNAQAIYRPDPLPVA